MRDRIKSIKTILFVGGIFALGVAASGGLGRLAEGLSSTAQAQPAQSCQVSDLAGKWAYSYHGELTHFGALTAVGVQTIDSSGHSVGTDTYAVDGDTTTLTFTGTYTLGPDCKGHAVYQFSDNTVGNSEIVMMDGGNEVHFVATDPGTSLLGVAKRR